MGVDVVDERVARFEAAKSRLYEGATVSGKARIDAFEAATRDLEVAVVAKTLRAVAGDCSYSIGRLDPTIIRRIADEVERMR